MINKEHIYLNCDINTQEDFFNFISTKLQQQNIVKDSFCSALKERESKFPTGLEFVEGFGVAIPHTEVQHCLKNSISFIQLTKTINFLDMEEAKICIPVRYIFVLTLTDPNEHIDILQNLFSLISTENFFIELKKKSTIEEYYEYLKDKLSNKE